MPSRDRSTAYQYCAGRNAMLKVRNPSFSIYTELAVSGAPRLIVPINADDSSRVATNAMFILSLLGQWPHT